MCLYACVCVCACFLFVFPGAACSTQGTARDPLLSGVFFAQSMHLVLLPPVFTNSFPQSGQMIIDPRGTTSPIRLRSLNFLLASLARSDRHFGQYQARGPPRKNCPHCRHDLLSILLGIAVLLQQVLDIAVQNIGNCDGVLKGHVSRIVFTGLVFLNLPDIDSGFFCQLPLGKFTSCALIEHTIDLVVVTVKSSGG